MNKRSEMILLTDTRFMYERLGKSKKPEFTPQFNASFKFILPLSDDLLSSFQTLYNLPNTNTFIDYDVQQTTEYLLTKLSNSQDSLSEIVSLAFATTDAKNTDLPSSDLRTRISNLKTFHEELLAPFFIFCDNITDNITTNLTAYNCLELLDIFLLKENLKCRDVLDEFPSEEKSFAYEESELKLRATFDKITLSKNRFFSEITKLKKAELFFLMSPADLAKTLLNIPDKILTTQELADSIEPTLEILKNAKAELVIQIELSKNGQLTLENFRNPLELVRICLEQTKLNSPIFQLAMAQCYTYRDLVFNKHIEVAALLTNKINTKIKVIDSFLFLRVAETAITFNLELTAKQISNTLTNFTKVFNANFVVSEAGFLISQSCLGYQTRHLHDPEQNHRQRGQ